MAVAAEVEDDDLFFSPFPAFYRFIDGGPDGMRRFRCRQEALGSDEEHGGFEDRILRISHRLDEPFIAKEA